MISDVMFESTALSSSPRLSATASLLSFGYDYFNGHLQRLRLLGEVLNILKRPGRVRDGVCKCSVGLLHGSGRIGHTVENLSPTHPAIVGKPERLQRDLAVVVCSAVIQAVRCFRHEWVLNYLKLLG